MDAKAIDDVAREMGSDLSRRNVLVKGGLAIGALLGVARVSGVDACARPAPDPCSCVVYVRSRTGLCGSGNPNTAAADYTESVMWNKGYKRVSPRAGAIMVWDRGAKGCNSSAGHMSLVRSAQYNNSTKKWVIYVDDANWVGCRITTNRLATNNGANWGDLWGVNFYIPR